MGPGASKIHPSECHLVQIPYNKIEDLAPARLPDSSLRCRQTHLPLRPPESGARPQRKEGVHFSTFSMHHRVSLAGPLLPRPWTLKTSRPRTVPRGFPVSHSPEVPWDMQLSRLPCSFPVPSLTGSLGRGSHTYTHLCFPHFSALPESTLEVPGGMPCSHPVAPRMPVVLQIQLTLACLTFCVAVCATLGEVVC